MAPFTVSSLIPYSGLAAIDRDLNELIFPLATMVDRTVLPAIEHLGDHWIAWDEPLNDIQRFHCAFLDKHAFLLARQHLIANGMVINLVGAPTLSFHLELHLIPQSEMLEHFGLCNCPSF